MKNLPLLIGTLVGTVLLVVFVAFMFSGSAQEVEVDPAVLTANTTLVKGAENPQVTVVEFADFQCPACRAAAPLTAQLLAQYPDQVQVIFRHFPLVSIHPNAQQASLVAQAAAEQDKFWEFHDLLFDRQSEWSDLRGQELDDKLGEYAEELEIDKTLLFERIQSDEIKGQVASDVSLANQLKVSGTPTFFVNGKDTPAPQLISTVESLLQN
jgi:protein-disulfide isomerase